MQSERRMCAVTHAIISFVMIQKVLNVFLNVIHADPLHVVYGENHSLYNSFNHANDLGYGKFIVEF